MKERLTKQEKDATHELKRNRRHFKKKRETILVRIQKKWLLRLKDRARIRKKTISKLNDEIYTLYFKYEPD